MASTREILGDQETLDALVANELEELIDEDVTKLGTSSLYNRDKLKTCDFKILSNIQNGALGYTSVRHLILRNGSIVTLGSNVFSETPIRNLCGTVYVPSDLLNDYKSNDQWKSYFIMPISSYPVTEFGTITDSWETIINNPNYATDYNIGDTKTVDFGKYGYVNMELVGVDVDDKDDGSGKAHMTWIAKDSITAHRMNASSTNANGWPATEMRTWLCETVLPELQSNIRNAIVEVNKTYYDYTSKSTKTEADTIWLPSMREVFGGTSYENDGAVYSDKFKDETSRIKKINGSAYFWWTRSAYSDKYQQFWSVQSSGSSIYYDAASGRLGVAPGFCIGGKSESQYWTDLVHAIEDGTYHKLYAVGDKLPYTVDGNTYHAVIVGIDADEDAYGNKVPVTFVTEELYATQYRMNATATNVGGWKDTEMRNTTLPSIKTKLPTYVSNNIVKAKKASYNYDTNTEQITVDDLWIPSVQEISGTNITGYESTGSKYSDAFPDANSLVKKYPQKPNNYGDNWWLRSAINNGTYAYTMISGSGGYLSNNANNANYITISFCIGLDAEKAAWNALYESIDDGTYATKYAVGDKLPYMIGDNVYHAVIAGIDVDEDENGNKVPVTFVTEELYAEKSVMNDTIPGSGDTNNGGWRDSKMRKTTMSAIEALMPEHLKNRINAVKKVSFYRTEEQITYDNLWIPSIQEVGITGYETTGNSYSGVFTNNDSRVKHIIGGTNNDWWTRSTDTNDYTLFKFIGSSGGFGNYGSSYSGGFPVSFSVGHIPEKIQWKMLADAVEDGTYKTAYAVGDLIPFTTSDGDTYHAQIAAFDTDEDAEGNKVPITFIMKELYGTKYRMNATDTNANGWEVTEMRRTTLPSIRAKMPSYVIDGVIPVKKLSYDKTTSANQETVDELWIPSAYEVGFTPYEGTGVKYTDLFTNDAFRVKNFNGTADYYLLRTAISSYSDLFLDVNSSGKVGSSYASYSSGFALGFCFGSVDKTTTKAPTSTDVSKAYAVEWDYSQTSPALTRKGLASSFTAPSPATSAEGTGSSPFDNIWPWAGMEVYNILPDGKKIKKGEEGFSFTDNDVMVYIPEFYYTAQKDTANSKWTWAISPTPIEGYEKHPGSGRFVGRYHASGDANAVASRSGVNPLVDTSQTNFRTYFKNKGENWYMMDIATWSAIQMLYLVEFANFDSQTMLGNGWNTSSIGSMGRTDSATYHTIKASKAHNQYRWVEDPFSNVLDWIDGYIGGTSSIYVGTDNSAFNGSTSKLTKAGSLKLPSSGYINGYGYSGESAWAFIPEAASGSESTYVPDYVVSGASYPADVGGNFYPDQSYGMFFFASFNDVSITNPSIGSRPIYLG